MRPRILSWPVSWLRLFGRLSVAMSWREFVGCRRVRWLILRPFGAGTAVP